MSNTSSPTIGGRRRAAAHRYDATPLAHEGVTTHTEFLAGLPEPGQPYAPQKPITKALQKLITDNDYTKDFTLAIRAVSRQGIPDLSRIKTLDQYYFYIDALVTWIPEIRHWELDGEYFHERTVYLRIVQFYYYFNQETLEDLQSPIAPVDGDDFTPLTLWMRQFAVEWGSFLDTAASQAALASFKYAPEYNWQDFQKAPEEYSTFNAFFARQFRDIDTQRPVAQKDNDRVIVFPAESTFVGQWSISTEVGDPMPAPPSIVVKHIEWPIEELLDHTGFAPDFAGGRFCHSFLNTYDYHRLHTPVGGKIIAAQFIPGQVYLEVGLQQQGTVTPNGDLANAVIPQRYLDAADPTGYQFVQCRGLIVIENEYLGKVACLPMGMAQVSSVVFTDPSNGDAPIVLTEDERAGKTYDQQVALLNKKIGAALIGNPINKGDMFSYFQFGGSDCVCVFEQRANVSVTAQVGVHYPIRSQYAFANYE